MSGKGDHINVVVMAQEYSEILKAIYYDIASDDVDVEQCSKIKGKSESTSQEAGRH